MWTGSCAAMKPKFVGAFRTPSILWLVAFLPWKTQNSLTRIVRINHAKLVASPYPCHPERIQINQPRVARNELPWGEPSQFSYPERVASASDGGGLKMRPAKLIAILAISILLAGPRPNFGA